MATTVWYVGPTDAGYIYAYTFRWDESTPVNSRTKAAKLFKDTRLEQIGELMDGWMSVKPLAVTNGAYAPSATWWVDPVLLYQKAEVPVPEPGPVGDITDADLRGWYRVEKSLGG